MARDKGEPKSYAYRVYLDGSKKSPYTLPILSKTHGVFARIEFNAISINKQSHLQYEES